jgi:hypothetical protein
MRLCAWRLLIHADVGGQSNERGRACRYKSVLRQEQTSGDINRGTGATSGNTLTRSGRIVDMEPVRVYRVDDEMARRVRARFNS